MGSGLLALKGDECQNDLFGITARRFACQAPCRPGGFLMMTASAASATNPPTGKLHMTHKSKADEAPAMEK
jgi:hypothetical protein